MRKFSRGVNTYRGATGYLHRHISSFSLDQAKSKVTDYTKEASLSLPSVGRKTKLLMAGGLITLTAFAMDQLFNDGEYCSDLTELFHDRLDPMLQMITSFLQESNESNPYAVVPYTGNIVVPPQELPTCSANGLVPYVDAFADNIGSAVNTTVDFVSSPENFTPCEANGLVPYVEVFADNIGSAVNTTVDFVSSPENFTSCEANGLVPYVEAFTDNIGSAVNTTVDFVSSCSLSTPGDFAPCDPNRFVPYIKAVNDNIPPVHSLELSGGNNVIDSFEPLNVEISDDNFTIFSPLQEEPAYPLLDKVKNIVGLVSGHWGKLLIVNLPLLLGIYTASGEYLDEEKERRLAFIHYIKNKLEYFCLFWDLDYDDKADLTTDTIKTLIDALNKQDSKNFNDLLKYKELLDSTENLDKTLQQCYLDIREKYLLYEVWNQLKSFYALVIEEDDDYDCNVFTIETMKTLLNTLNEKSSYKFLDIYGYINLLDKTDNLNETLEQCYSKIEEKYLTYSIWNQLKSAIEGYQVDIDYVLDDSFMKEGIIIMMNKLTPYFDKFDGHLKELNASDDLKKVLFEIDQYIRSELEIPYKIRFLFRELNSFIRKDENEQKVLLTAPSSVEGFCKQISVELQSFKDQGQLGLVYEELFEYVGNKSDTLNKDELLQHLQKAIDGCVALTFDQASKLIYEVSDIKEQCFVDSICDLLKILHTSVVGKEYKCDIFTTGTIKTLIDALNKQDSNNFNDLLKYKELLDSTENLDKTLQQCYLDIREKCFIYSICDLLKSLHTSVVGKEYKCDVFTTDTIKTLIDALNKQDSNNFNDLLKYKELLDSTENLGKTLQQCYLDIKEKERIHLIISKEINNLKKTNPITPILIKK